MRFATIVYWTFCALNCACVASRVLGADDAPPAEIQPALQANLSPDGLITWWLVSSPIVPPYMAQPPRVVPPGAKPPSNAREGEAVFAGDGAPAGNWSLGLSGTYFNDFKEQLNGQSGWVFASTRVNSADGGARMLFINTYCAVEVYLNGARVVCEPQPEKTKLNTVPVTLPKGLSEIVVALDPREEHCLMQFVLQDARSKKPGKKGAASGDTIVVPVAKGKAADAAAAAFGCLMLAPQAPFISPGGKTMIMVFLQGSVPLGAGALSARLAQPAVGEPMPFTLDKPLQLEFGAPAETKSAYEAKIDIFSDGKSLGVKTLSLLCLEGIVQEADAIGRHCADETEKSGRAFPNTRLALEKIKLFVDGLAARTIDPDAETIKEMSGALDSAHRYALVEAQGVDPLKGTSGYMERAYISTIDDGVQPYLAAVPEAAVKNGGDKFPLVVFLHGYDPNMNKHRWWEAKDYADVCTRNNCCLAIPFGRTNTDFQSCGEVDVLDVIKEMKAHYRIDPDRVYLVGISMGGMGVYTIAAHYPGEFAAGIVLAGRADSPLQNNTALENFHPFKQWLMQADNPISLCENLTNLPLRIYHGQDDPVVPPTQATRMAAALKRAGCNAQLFMVPGEHRAGFDVIREQEPLQWLLTNKRNPNPATHHLKTYSLQYVGNFLVTTTDALEPIDVEWTGEGGKGRVEIIKKSANVLNFSGPVNFGDPALKKDSNLCGPVRQAICAPFTIVYGTKGNAAANAANKANAEHFAADWFAFTRSKAKIKADMAVTAEEKHDRNLFLFGEEQDNALHSELAKDLPISIKNGNVTIAGKTVPLADKGIMYIYPSAFSEHKHAVVICAGIPYGEKIGVNHKLDLIPDFLLYGPTPDTDGTSTNKPVCAGFFGNDWNIDVKTMWWFDK